MVVWNNRLITLETCSDTLIVAQDVMNRHGRCVKRFALCKSWSEYENLLLISTNNNLYEVIPCGYDTPTWFFADHDCKAVERFTETSFMEAVINMYLEYFSLKESDIGVLIFASSSCRQNKLSAHIKVSIPMTLRRARLHAMAVHNRCEDEALKPDLAPYASSNQQIRAIGHSKPGSAKKVAYRDKAPLYMHLIRRNPDCNQSTHEEPNVTEEDCEIFYDKERRCASYDEIQILRKVMLNCGLREFLGDLFDPMTCAIEQCKTNDETMTCYIDGTKRRGGTVVCPYAKRVHKGNRLRISLTGGLRGTLRCYCADYNCNSKHCTNILKLHYNILSPGRFSKADS